MTNNLSNYDKRQILQIKKHVELLKNNEISLQTFIEQLEALISVMENVDPVWKNEIYQNWSELETIFAWSMYKANEPIHDIDIQTINESIKQIENLTDAYMNENNFSLLDEGELYRLE